MHRLWLALRIFWNVLVNGEIARRMELAYEQPGEATPKPPEQPPERQTEKKPEKVAEKKPAAPPKPARSEALTLLAALQREARLVDFLQEPLDDYSDDQIGAAVRDVHRDAHAVLQRMFALKPVVDAEEQASVQVPAGFDPLCYKLSGNVAGDPPYQGQLEHHGWQATKSDLPQWNGTAAAAMVVHPAEVELK